MAGLATTLGAGAATNSFAQIPDVDTIFLFGANPTEAHPIVGLHLKEALQNGAKLIVTDPRKTWMAEHADIWMNLKVGSNIALVNGLINVILENGWENKEFIAKQTEDIELLREKVAEYDLDRVEKLTGVTKDLIIEAAKMYSHADKAMILYGLGVTHHRTGSDNVMALSNLALVCGQIGRPSTGIMPLRGQNNVQGASDLGPVPTALPGYQSVTDEKVREKFGKAWNVTIKKEPGLQSMQMLDECVKGTFKGIFILGEDPAQTDPDLHHVRKALEAVDFLVVQELFHTETTKYADVILPGASFAEKDGTFTNGERLIQRVRKAIEPLAGIPEWKAICKLSTLMGYPMDYDSPSDIMDEIASLVPIYGGISYERLEKAGIHWPCPDKNHPGTTTLYTDTFPRAKGLAAFRPVDHIGSGEVPDEEYPLVLITARVREHYNNGSMTRRAQGIAQIVPVERVEMNPEDAETLGIKDLNWVLVSSRRGEVKVRVKVTDRSQPGNVFMAFHHQTALTNELTSGHRDPVTSTPEYKSCAVKVEKYTEPA